jgi:hypothetical protein
MNLQEAEFELEIDNFKLDTVKITEANLGMAFYCYDDEELINLVYGGKKYFSLPDYLSIEIDDMKTELSQDNEFWQELLTEPFTFAPGKIEQRLRYMIADRIQEIKSDYEINRGDI